MSFFSTRPILKYLLLGGFIFLIQTAVFVYIVGIWEFKINREVLVPIYLKCSLIAFVVFYWLFSLSMKRRNVLHFFALGFGPMCMVIYVLIMPEVIKARAADGIYLLVFMLLMFLFFDSGKWTKISLVVLYCLVIWFTYMTVYMFIYYSNEKFSSHEEKLSKFVALEAIMPSGQMGNPFISKGKTVFIDVWNKSCGSCIKNLPKVRDLQRYFANDTNVVIISLYGALRESESKDWFYEEYSKRFDSLGIHFTFVDSENFTSLNIRAFPQYFMIFKSGKIMRIGDPSFDKEGIFSIYKELEKNRNAD